RQARAPTLSVPSCRKQRRVPCAPESGRSCVLLAADADDAAVYSPAFTQHPPHGGGDEFALNDLDALVKGFLCVIVPNLDGGLRDDGTRVDALIDDDHGASRDLRAASERIAYAVGA